MSRLSFGSDTRWRVALVWLALFALPLWPGVDLYQFAQLLCYGLFAVSLAFVWQQAGLLCFGHALFFGVGAYLSALLAKGMLPGLPQSAWLGLAFGALGGGLAAALLGASLFYGRVVRGAFFGIVTLCAAVIAERLAINWDAIGGFNGLLDVPPVPLWSDLDMLSPVVGYASVLVLVALATAAAGWLAASPWGTVLRGIAADEVRVSTMGYPVARHKIVAFGLGGAMAGLAGALFAGQFGFVAPSTLGFGLSTEVLIWVAIGGRQSLTGSLLGAVFLKYLEGFLSDTLGQYWLLVLGGVLVIVVMYFPRGALGGVLASALPPRLRKLT